MGDPLPQRHSPRAGASQRTDRGRIHRPCGDAGGRKALLRRRAICRNCLRHEECGRRRGYTGYRAGAADGREREAAHSRGRIVHRAGPGDGAGPDGLHADGPETGGCGLRAVQYVFCAGFRDDLRFPSDAVHRRSVPPCLSGFEGGSGGKRAVRAERQGVLWGVPGQDGPPGGGRAQSRQPYRLRLRDTGVHTGRGRKDTAYRSGSRRGQGRESAVRRRPDRGRRGDVHGLCADGTLPP